MKGFLLRRLLSIIQLNIRRNLASSRTGGKKLTHYDVLKISNDSTKNEIRSAFIKLSKELHPDMNKELQNTHQEFVKLNEAYSILSKSEARRQYDLTLREKVILSPVSRERPSPVHDPWRDPSLFHNRDKSKDNKDGRNSYYGIKSVKRVSNSWIALIILAVAAVGTVLQALLIRYSVTLKRNALDDASAKYGAMHKAIRSEVAENGNNLQIERMKIRLGDHDSQMNTKD